MASVAPGNASSQKAKTALSPGAEVMSDGGHSRPPRPRFTAAASLHDRPKQLEPIPSASSWMSQQRAAKADTFSDLGSRHPNPNVLQFDHEAAQAGSTITGLGVPKPSINVGHQSHRSGTSQSSVDKAATKYVEQLARAQVSPPASGRHMVDGSLSPTQLAAGARIIREASDALTPVPDSGEGGMKGRLPSMGYFPTPAPKKDTCHSRFHARVAAVVRHPMFERVVIALILINMVFVSTWDPLDDNPKSVHNQVLDISDTVFQCLFTVEMVLKIYALGLILPRNAYLRDTWNVIDGLLVVMGWITYRPVGSSNVSVGRLVRVLRPLRTISHVPGLKLIINSMLASIPQLLNVLGLCAFIFFMFGIVGIQLFQGKLSQRCHFPASGGSPAYVNQDDSELCSTGSTGRSCPVVGGVQTVCMDSGESVNSGITNFDNIATAFLTIFQCITLEGWVDVMYWISDTSSMWFNIYFVCLVTFGSLFVLNLVVAVITLNLSAERSSQDVMEKAKHWQELAHIPEARLLVGNTAFGTADLMTQLVATTYQREAELQRMKRRTSAARKQRDAFAANKSVNVLVEADDKSNGDDNGSAGRASPSSASGRNSTRSMSGRLTASHARPHHKRAASGGSLPAMPMAMHVDAKSDPRSFGLARSPEAWSTRDVATAGAAAGGGPSGQGSSESKQLVVAGSRPVVDAGGMPAPRSLPPLSSKHGGDALMTSKQSEAHLRRALQLMESNHTQEAMGALQLAWASLGAEATAAAAKSRGGDGCGDGRMSLVSHHTDVTGSEPDHDVVVAPAQSLQRGAGASSGVGGTDGMRRRPNGGGSGSGGGGGHRRRSGGSDSSGSEPRIDSARFEAARTLMETPHGGKIDDPLSDTTVVRFTDSHGRPLPAQQQRSSIVATVAEDDSRTLVQMRLPASRRFGPFPYSPAWRWGAWHVVSHPAFDITILSLILINTVALAVEHHDMDEGWQTALQWVNLVLTVAFGLEMLLKVAGLGLEGYCADRFNVFDGLLVAINLVELSVQDGSGDATGVSALRTFRLMRVFKLMRSWSSLNVIITNILKSLPRIGPFTVVLLLFMVVYALIGMQLFGGEFGSLAAGDLPRTHYDNLLWSFVTTFQILTGENWNEVMYVGINKTGWLSVLYFVSLVVLGTYIVLNLFLGILIDNFRQDEDEECNPEEGIMQEAREEIQKRLGESVDLSDDPSKAMSMHLYMQGGHVQNVVIRKAMARLASRRRMQKMEEQLKSRRFREHECAKHTSLYFLGPDNGLRLRLGSMVIHPMFDAAILVLITFSCVLLALDSQTASQGTRDFIEVADVVLTIVFSLELLLKVLAFGLYKHPGAYLRDGWNILDGTIVFFSILAIIMAEQEVKVIKVIRFARALRPLRVVKRLAGLRLVVNSVVKALPHCFHVAMLSVALFLLFGILGVNFFGGRFYSCTDPSRVCLPRLAGASCTADLACTGTWVDDTGATVAREWVNPSYAGVSEYSFDSSLAALLTLFEVANLELWHEVMWKAADVTKVGWAPERDANQYAVFYFIAFVVMASFFMLNLFVSVVVDNFNRLKHAALASPFLTPSQRKWIEMQERITRRRPRMMAVPPAASWREKLFHVIMHTNFEFTIMGLIMLNVLVMAARYHTQPAWWGDVLDGANIVFGVIFILEVVVKTVGLGWGQYWSSGWNRFDFSVVVINLVTFVLGATIGDIGVDFTLLRAVRVVRLFRLVKTSRRLRTIFTTLYLSLPSLANVGALLLLLFFMYAIAGMTLFAEVPHGTFITKHANFEDFINSMLLLLRMSTGESWNGIMHDCAGTVHKSIVFFYFTSFMLLGQFMMLNLFVAVILENFEREMEAEADDNEIKPEQLDAFAALWAKLVVKQPATPGTTKDAAWLPAEKLAEILLSLPPPLGLHTQHRTSRSRLMKAIRVLDIPINKAGKIHYSQTLRALVRRVCGEDLPTDMDEATQKTLPRQLQLIQPFLSNYSTSQLFAAKFVQLWVRSVYARRKAMAGDHFGKLVVTVLGARHLKDLDAFGKQDPYVAFWIEPEEVYVSTRRKARGKSKARVGTDHGFTDTRYKGGTDCYWGGGAGQNGRVELHLSSPVVGRGAVVVWAEAWDEDVGSADDLIGMAPIPIFAALAKGEDIVTVPLIDASGAGGCGELCVRVTWIPDGAGQRQALAQRRASLDAELSEQALQRLNEEGERFRKQFEQERRRGSGVDVLEAVAAGAVGASSEATHGTGTDSSPA